MSKTPRTDNNIAFTDYAVCGDPLVYTYASFSRQLESELVEKDRQLAEARAEIERKDKLIEQMREALRLALPEARSTHVEQTILAALAAERGGK